MWPVPYSTSSDGDSLHAGKHNHEHQIATAPCHKYTYRSCDSAVVVGAATGSGADACADASVLVAGVVSSISWTVGASTTDGAVAAGVGLVAGVGAGDVAATVSGCTARG